MAIRPICDAAYNAHTEPLFKKSAILPLPYLCEYFKVQFMQKLHKVSCRRLLMMFGLQMLFVERTKIMLSFVMILI